MGWFLGRLQVSFMKFFLKSFFAKGWTMVGHSLHCTVHAQDRDCARALPDGAADQDLVPEPADEVEEGAQDGEHERDADAPDAPRPCLWSPSAPPGLLHVSL